MTKSTKIAIFEGRKIRRHWDEEKEKWYFSVVDVLAALSDSKNPQVYWRVLKKRLLDEGSGETVTKCNALKMVSADGKMRLTDVADTEPFKLWLARVGYERVEESEDPELMSPVLSLSLPLSFPRNLSSTPIGEWESSTLYV